jgi:hypothetical protein
MNWVLKHGGRRVMIGTVVIGLGAASTTWAMIPDQDGVIHGCYAKVRGVVRVIDTEKGGKCSKEVGEADRVEPEGRAWRSGAYGPEGRHRADRGEGRYRA